MTSHDVIETILSEIPEHNRNQTVDTLKTGKDDAEVSAIGVTFMATVPVLMKAAELGVNFLITHEPTFYNHADNVESLVNDPVYQYKRRFIDEHRIGVWRCHDSWHRLRPDGIVTGMARKLGWENQQEAARRPVFVRDAIPLRDLANELKQKLGAQVVRMIGDPNLPCRRVGFAVGCPAGSSHPPYFVENNVDALICGEVREWETAEYVRDAQSAGKKWGLLIVGHCASEEAGMQHLAHWLSERIKTTPIHFIPAGDPFWYA